MLDGVNRLAIFNIAFVHMQFANGLFAVIKDALKDRLILDARVPNLYERALTFWTYTMASIYPLLNYYLPPAHVFTLHAVDLSDFYYQFVVSAVRAARNVFVGTYSVEDLNMFRCFKHF